MPDLLNLIIITENPVQFTWIIGAIQHQAVALPLSRDNVLVLTLSHCHSSVKYHLFKTLFMPLCGSQLWALKESQRLYTTWYKAARRIYTISPRSHRKCM